MSQSLPRRVVILLHARDRRAERRPYQIWGLADVWRASGIDVVVRRGPDGVPDGDVVVNHVDLTVVPDAYARHMERYPVAINGRALDLSKRRVSTNLLRHGDSWTGPVIVKTDRNCGGRREREILEGGVLRRLRDLRTRLSGHPWRSRRTIPTDDYPVLPSVADVPPDVWENPLLVVERFLAEREGELYVLRSGSFFGSHTSAGRSVGAGPVVKSGTVIRKETIDMDPTVLAAARRLGLDRGKVDWVVHEGKPVLLDANRTSTLGPSMTPEQRARRCEGLAPGLAEFWPPRS